MSDNGEHFGTFEVKWDEDIDDMDTDNILLELVNGFEFEEVFGVEFEPEPYDPASTATALSERIAPQTQSPVCVTPRTEPNPQSKCAPTHSSAPEAEAITPEAEAITPEAEPSTPEAEPSTPEAEPSTPEAEPSTPEAEPSAPKPRFKSLKESELQEIEEYRYSAATKKNTKWGVQMFQDWCMSNNGYHVDTQNIMPEELCVLLRKFYAETQPRTSATRAGKFESADLASEYHKNTLKNVRAAINRHLKDLGRNIDIVRDREFRDANEMLNAKLKLNLKKGLSVPTKHKPIISNQDQAKIIEYLQGNTPVILRFRLWYVLSVHFVSRGLEFHPQLKLDSFLFRRDENDHEYVVLGHETKKKQWQGGIETPSNEVATEKRMYATGDLSCPIECLKTFISKCNPEAPALFCQCDKHALSDPENTAIWYNIKPVTQRQFSRFMQDICKNASTTSHYTAHCLRATATETLNNAGVETRHIMLMTGHKNEASVRSYSRGCSTVQKHTMSNILATLSTETNSSNSSLVPVPQPETSETSIAGGSNPTSMGMELQSAETRPPLVSSPITVGDRSMPAGISNSTFSNCSFNLYTANR